MLPRPPNNLQTFGPIRLIVGPRQTVNQQQPTHVQLYNCLTKQHANLWFHLLWRLIGLLLLEQNQLNKPNTHNYWIQKDAQMPQPWRILPPHVLTISITNDVCQHVFFTLMLFNASNSEAVWDHNKTHAICSQMADGWQYALRLVVWWGYQYVLLPDVVSFFDMVATCGASVDQV